MAVTTNLSINFLKRPAQKDLLAEAKLILTDELIRDALRADKLAKAEAANQNEEDNETPIN